jgi:hypothetical protein
MNFSRRQPGILELRCNFRHLPLTLGWQKFTGSFLDIFLLKDAERDSDHRYSYHSVVILLPH